MKKLLGAALISVCSVFTAAAQQQTMRFWNLTANTLTSLQLSPAGANVWGKNQCENDNDGTVDFRERLRITGIAPGQYDARFTDDTGRTCTVRNLTLKSGAVFSIEEKNLKDCTK
jgi:hypothetical protein